MGKQWKHWETIFWVSKFTADGDCSHEIKRLLLLGKRAMPNLESILKSRDTTLPTKIHLGQSYGFSSSVQFSRSVVSSSLGPHELQHARCPYPSPALRVHPNPCPLSQWCHPTISSSVVPFSSLQSFPAWGSFPMNQLFAWGGPSIGVSASMSVLPMKSISFRMDCSPRDSQESSPTPQFKSINSSVLSFIYSPTITFIHDYWKNHSFD